MLLTTSISMTGGAALQNMDVAGRSDGARPGQVATIRPLVRHFTEQPDVLENNRMVLEFHDAGPSHNVASSDGAGHSHYRIVVLAI